MNAGWRTIDIFIDRRIQIGYYLAPGPDRILNQPSVIKLKNKILSSNDGKVDYWFFENIETTKK